MKIEALVTAFNNSELKTDGGLVLVKYFNRIDQLVPVKTITDAFVTGGANYMELPEGGELDENRSTLTALRMLGVEEMKVKVVPVRLSADVVRFDEFPNARSFEGMTVLDNIADLSVLVMKTNDEKEYFRVDKARTPTGDSLASLVFKVQEIEGQSENV